MSHRENAPWVAQSRDRTDQIAARAQLLLRGRTEDRFRELVLEWARRESGPFPTRATAEREAREELELLCRGLGPWAALTPGEVFPVGLTPAERAAPVEDEGWW